MILRKMKIEDYDNVYALWMSCVEKERIDT